MNCSRISGAAIILLLCSSTVNADVFSDFRDYVRSFDLNDYMLGVSVDTSDSPYAGGDNSRYAYPFLTSFQDPSLTDDKLLLSEGDVGLRRISQAGWVIGVIGRVQTLGLGNPDSPELSGLDERKWSLEGGLLMGWRGWPVHFDWRTHFEILDRHDGATSKLAVLLPRKRDWGYVVPSASLVYRSANYTNYYFGVSPDEALPSRPEYAAGSSISTKLQLGLGYALTEKWLLKARLGMEFYDDEIGNSPIVDEGKVWSASIGFAYNSDLFQPKVSTLRAKKQPNLEIRLAVFNAGIDSTITRDAADGTRGTEIDLSAMLGAPDAEAVLQLGAIYRVNPFHRFELDFQRLSFNGHVALESDIDFGETSFRQGTDVSLRFESVLTRLGYAYSLINDDQKELGIMAGLHLSKNVTRIAAPATGQRERSEYSTPLPVAGLHGSVELGSRSTLGAKSQIFALDFDRLEGHMVFLTLEWQRRFGDHFSAGLAYQLYLTELESRSESIRGAVKNRYHGPALYFSANF